MRILIFITLLFQISCSNDLNFDTSLDDSSERSLTDLSKGSVLVGDMLLDEEDFHHYFEAEENEEESTDGPELGTMGAAYSGIRLWPNAIIPVAFSSSFSADEKKSFFEYCKHWGEKSSVKCVNRSNQTGYLYVTKSRYGNSSACFSEVGYKPERRMMWLPGGCATSKRSILHELGHTIGLMHEHQRPDRDAYVRIKWSNIISSYKYAFEKQRRANSKKTSFDFQSIMLYQSWAFTKNRQPTLVKYSNNKETWNRSNKLSSKDKQVAGMLYPQSNSGGGLRYPASNARRIPRERNDCRIIRGVRIRRCFRTF